MPEEKTSDVPFQNVLVYSKSILLNIELDEFGGANFVVKVPKTLWPVMEKILYRVEFQSGD